MHFHTTTRNLITPTCDLKGTKSHHSFMMFRNSSRENMFWNICHMGIQFLPRCISDSEVDVCAQQHHLKIHLTHNSSYQGFYLIFDVNILQSLEIRPQNQYLVFLATSSGSSLCFFTKDYLD